MALRSSGDMRPVWGGKLRFAADRFDLAQAACVWHHSPAERYPRVVRELQRVVRPGGALMRDEHNPWNPVVVRVVRGGPFDERAVPLPAPALRNKVREAGFTQVVATHRVFCPRPLRALRGLENSLGWLLLGAQYPVVGPK